MARLINNSTETSIKVSIETLFENGTSSVKTYAIGDVIEGLRYVENGEIVTVSGKLTNINYSVASKSAFNKNNPVDTTREDITIKSITIDASTMYNAKTVTISMEEIIEDEGVEDVQQILYYPEVAFSMDLYYSNRSHQHIDIQVGDTFNNVKILNPTTMVDITGEFTVVAFIYKAVKGALTVTAVVFRSIDGSSTVNTELKYILALNEIYTYEANTTEGLTTAITNAADGDTVDVSDDIDVSTGALAITGKNITLNLGDSKLSGGNSANAGLKIQNGTVVVNGGVLESTQNYSSTAGAGLLEVGEGGKLILNDTTMDAVRENPVDNGHFGLTLMGNGSATINSGDYKAGWYCTSGNGARTTEDSVLTINGGTFQSVADYALYLPHPGKTIVNGGTIKGAAGAIAMNNGYLEINGGEFETAGNGDTGEWSDGTSGLANAALNINARYGDCTVKITDGVFKCAGDSVIIATGTNHNVKITVTGGQFSTPIDASFIAAGYACSSVVNENGLYYVYKLSA